MKSLTDLNTSSSATIEYTDNRAADVVWVKVNHLVLEETSTQNTVTVKHSYDIFEIRQPQSTNITYEINVPTPLVPSWPNFPSELTLVQVGTVYTITGITTLDHWNAIKNGTITAPDGYQGNFTYEVDLKYFDTVGQQTLHWEVNEYLPVSLLASEFDIDVIGGIRYPLASDMIVFTGLEAEAIKTVEIDEIISSFDLEATARIIKVFNNVDIYTNPDLFGDEDDKFGKGSNAGYSIDANDSILAVSAYYADTSAENSVGRLYIYNITNGATIASIENPITPFPLEPDNYFTIGGVAVNSNYVVTTQPNTDYDTLWIYDTNGNFVNSSRPSASGSYPLYLHKMDDNILVLNSNSSNQVDASNDITLWRDPSTGDPISSIDGLTNGKTTFDLSEDWIATRQHSVFDQSIISLSFYPRDAQGMVINSPVNYIFNLYELFGNNETPVLAANNTYFTINNRLYDIATGNYILTFRDESNTDLNVINVSMLENQLLIATGTPVGFTSGASSAGPIYNLDFEGNILDVMESPLPASTAEDLDLGRRTLKAGTNYTIVTSATSSTTYTDNAYVFVYY